MLTYKQEWAEILMNAQETTESVQTGANMTEKEVYKVQGTLIYVNDEMGTVILDRGILLQMPLLNIRVHVK